MCSSKLCVEVCAQPPDGKIKSRYSGRNTDSMFGCGTQTLQWLAVLAVSLMEGRAAPRYFLVQRSMSWFEAREHCRMHYVDLAVPSLEEQYLALVGATTGERRSFWVGLRRRGVYAGWTWVDDEALGYERWFRKNPMGDCASLEAGRGGGEKLLARYCDEALPFVCQGPVGPPSVWVDSVGSHHMTLSWTVPAFMQLTPHRYRVTACPTPAAAACDTLFHSFTPGSASVNVSIHNASSNTEYSIEVTAFVLRPDNATGPSVVLQSHPVALRVLTANCCVRATPLRLLKYASVAAFLWVVFLILIKDPKVEPVDELEQVTMPTETRPKEQIPVRTRGCG